MQLGFRVLSWVVFGLLVFGATVRVHGAGLSCPDWPLCFGQVVPEMDFAISLEWGHRVLASLVSMGFLGLGAMVLFDRTLRASQGRWIVAAGVVLLLQIVLGGLTVLHLLADWSVTLHLLTGNLFLFQINSLAIRLGPAPAGSVSGPLRLVTLTVFAFWFVQMGLGGYVSSNHAGTACSEWPTCNGGVWFPTWSGPIGLQLLHRLGAYVLTGVTLLFLGLAIRDSAMRKTAWLVAALLFCQIVLGVTNVWLGLPVETAVLHSAVGDLLGFTLGFGVWNVLRRPLASSLPTTGTVGVLERA